MSTKAMPKEIISGFSIFEKDKTKLFSCSNWNRNLINIFVFAKISPNKCGRKCETQNYKNYYENNQYFCVRENFAKQMWKEMWNSKLQKLLQK